MKEQGSDEKAIRSIHPLGINSREHSDEAVLSGTNISLESKRTRPLTVANLGRLKSDLLSLWSSDRQSYTH
jgi:hypothetical protein